MDKEKLIEYLGNMEAQIDNEIDKTIDFYKDNMLRSQMSILTTILRAIDNGNFDKEPCEYCKNGEYLVQIPAFRPVAISNQHLAHEPFTFRLLPQYCPACGRDHGGAK